ncbi:MAG: hypothetical protein OEN23_09260 [Paracoccaceae bacterium]|nr:hypothetical protein [Paracoccaceae bacterium]
MTCTLIGIAGFALVLAAFRHIRLPQPDMIPIPIREAPQGR